MIKRNYIKLHLERSRGITMRIFLVLFSLFISTSTLFAEGSNSSRIAAIVNKSIISQSDLMNRIQLAAVSSGLEVTPANLEKIRPQMLRMMIDEKLQLEVGQKYKITIPQDQIKGAIKGLEESNGMQEGGIEKLLTDNNIPLKTLEDQIRANLVWISYIREKYSPTLQIADWEMDQEVKLQQEKETKTQYHLAEIVLPFDGPEQEERAKNDLNRLAEELQKGAHFTALAQQFSASATAAQGGDMGWLTEDQIGPEIKEALVLMTPGQLSQPIRTPQGYLILAFIEQKLPGPESRAIVSLQQVLLPFPKDVTEDSARAIMTQASEISKAAKSCPDLEKIVKEKFTGAQTHLAEKKQLNSLPEPLQKVIQPLSVNQTSEPLLTEDGALLIMVCEKATGEEKKFTKDEARDIITERKLTLLSKRELRDFKRHAFIEMRM